MQEGHDVIRNVRHLFNQRVFRIVPVTQQSGELLSQRQDLRHQRSIVPFPGVGTLLRGAGVIGRVHFLPELPVVCISHYRLIGGILQREQPAGLIPLARSLGCQFKCGCGQTDEQRLVRHRFCPAVGGIQQVLFILCLQFRETLLQLLVPVLIPLSEVDARQAEIPQGITDNLLPGDAQPGIFLAIGQCLAGVEQVFVLSQFGGVVGQLGQAGVIGPTQVIVIGHRVQVTDGRPGAIKLIVLVFKGLE